MRFRNFRFRSAIFAVLLTVLLASSTPAQQDGGYVLSLKGNWFLKANNQRLERFRKLPPGATITVRKPIDKADYITVALFSGGTIQRRCSQAPGCGAPFVISGAKATGGMGQVDATLSAAQKPAPRSLIGRLSETFLSLFDHPVRYFVVTKARPGVEQFQDIVTSQDSGKVDLSPMFRDVPSATYHLIAVPVSLDNSPETGPDSANISFNIRWNKREPNLASTDKLYPGLFGVVSGSYFQGWVLVTKPGQYLTVSKCVERATQNASEWVPDEDRLAARMFLRAYLATLAKDLRRLSNQDDANLGC